MRYFHQYHKTAQVIHNQKIVFEPHLHHEVEIIALYHGNATVTIEGARYAIEAGDFVVVFPNTVHSYTTEDEVEVGKFIFSPKQLPELERILDERQPLCPVISVETARQAGLPALSRDILSHYATASPPVQKAYLLLLTGKLLEFCPLEPRPAGQDLLAEVFTYCAAHFRHRITQKEVAQALHISESHLSHLFCCKLKINFCQYVNNLRINEACRLLTETDKSIIDIGEESGFSSLRSFNRVFQYHCGITPTEYRKGYQTTRESR